MNYTTAIYVCVSYCEVQLQKYSAGVNINLLLLRSPWRILNLKRKGKENGSAGYRGVSRIYAFSSIFFSPRKTGYQMPGVWLCMQINTRGLGLRRCVSHTHTCNLIVLINY